ncbi:MAG: hypothetical protein KGQ48_13580 [Bradyrhizobium sp.]|nr:hypothetical protein [Bradyrhizobium sp.]
MRENRKFPHSRTIWDNASRARDIQLALMFELATTAFIEGWEALRLHMPPATQTSEPDHKAGAASTDDKADAR